MAAVFVTEGCARALKRETDLGAGRAEILALEEQWATTIERREAAAFDRLAAEAFRFIDDVLRSIAFGSRRRDSR